MRAERHQTQAASVPQPPASAGGQRSFNLQLTHCCPGWLAQIIKAAPSPQTSVFRDKCIELTTLPGISADSPRGFTWCHATSLSRVMLWCCCHAVSRVTSSVTCSPASGPLATGSHLGTVSGRRSCIADSRGAAARCCEMSRPRKLNIRGLSCVWARG